MPEGNVKLNRTFYLTIKQVKEKSLFSDMKLIQLSLHIMCD